MGLDMYLTATRYVSKYFVNTDEETSKTIGSLFPELANFVEEDGSFPIKGVRIEAGYWRKANSIHGWFVQNVQDGDDDCGIYPVGRDQLIQLRDHCQQVLDNPELADDLLPTRAGFFFGDTSYDEYYFSDLKDTIDIINKCLTLPELWDFEYHASW